MISTLNLAVVFTNAFIFLFYNFCQRKLDTRIFPQFSARFFPKTSVPGDRKEFVLPDRNKYVNMQRHFLSKYMKLVVQTCHSRGAHATGGMAALLLNENESDAIKKVVAAKQMEIETGVDGFMVYDLKLVPHMNNVCK